MSSTHIFLFTSNKYAKFQSNDPVLEGIFMGFSRYTMKTLEYCRAEVFALNKFSSRKVFWGAVETKMSHMGQDTKGEYGG